MNPDDEQVLAISGTLCATGEPPFPERHALAAQLAVEIEAANPPAHETLAQRTAGVLKAADQIYAWLSAPGPAVSLQLTVDRITDQATGRVATPNQGASIMANTELGDNQQATVTANPKDADGQPTTDTITWAASDASNPTSDAVTLEVSADTLSVTVLGAVPTEDVTLTATDTNGNTGTVVFDVLSGPATSLGLSVGPVTDQTPAPTA